MDVRRQFLKYLTELGILDSADDVGFSMRNYVYTADLSQTVDLNALSLHLGLEQIEYEPEQFPALVYRPEEGECVMLVFSNGKVVLTGLDGKGVAEKEFLKLESEIELIA